MTPNEKNLIELIKNIKAEKVERISDREYDLRIEGKYSEKDKYMPGVAFSAWLPLLAIRELVPWTDNEVASRTDHPEMCEQGDWSGMRDSSKETLWLIFEKYVPKG